MYPGNDIANTQTDTWEECVLECQANSECTVWVWGGWPDSKGCYLKTGNILNPDRISGTRDCFGKNLNIT